MKVLITGADGQLASVMHDRMRSEHDVIALSRADLDLTDHQRVQAVVHARKPDVVINGAAYNNVDGAEDDALTALAVNALAVNALAVRSLALASETVGARLVHYSTDFVFDGIATQPYTEQSEPNPQSVYGSSKLLGEWFAETCRRHYVLRVESLFGGGVSSGSSGRPRGSSIDRIADALLAGREVRAFQDRVVSPSYVEDVAAATVALLAGNVPFGLYHCVGSGMGTWVDVATELATSLETTTPIVPIDQAEAPLRAKRPRYCALSNAKLTAAGVPMPSWQDALRRYALARRAALA